MIVILIPVHPHISVSALCFLWGLECFFSLKKLWITYRSSSGSRSTLKHNKLACAAQYLILLRGKWGAFTPVWVLLDYNGCNKNSWEVFSV